MIKIVNIPGQTLNIPRNNFQTMNRCIIGFVRKVQFKVTQSGGLLCSAWGNLLDQTDLTVSTTGSRILPLSWSGGVWGCKYLEAQEDLTLSLTDCSFLLSPWRDELVGSRVSCLLVWAPWEIPLCLCLCMLLHSYVVSCTETWEVFPSNGSYVLAFHLARPTQDPTELCSKNDEDRTNIKS